jgi:hypothetical protein
VFKLNFAAGIPIEAISDSVSLRMILDRTREPLKIGTPSVWVAGTPFRLVPSFSAHLLISDPKRARAMNLSVIRF